MPRSLIRRAISLLLLALTVGMGPGLALAEAAAHADTGKAGHGRRDHFEPRGGQDHDDQCAVGVATSLARGTLAGCTVFRAPARTATPPPAPAITDSSPAPALLPPSRAPPSPA